MSRKAKVRKEPCAQEAAVADQSESLQQPQQATPPAAPPGGRDAQGRFLPGAPAGPGNPHARHCARMLEMFRNAISDDEMYYLCRLLWDKACKGDLSAIKFIWQYKIGRPSAAPNPDLIDRDEWDHYQKDAMTMDEMKVVLGRFPSRVGNSIAGAALPSLAYSMTQELAKQLMKSLPKSMREAIAASNNPQSEPAPSVQEEPKPDEEIALSSDASTHQTELRGKSGSAKNNNPVSDHPSSPANRVPTRTVPNGKQTSAAKASDCASPSPDGPDSSSRGSNPERPTKRKMGGKLVSKQWLQPLARKMNASKRQGKKRQLAHAG